MADTPASSGSASTPWFVTQTGGTSGTTGQTSITSQRAALNQAVNGIANDLKNQQASLNTALNAILTAINNQPSHA